MEKIKDSFADFCVAISQSRFEYPIEDIKVYLLMMKTFSVEEKAEIKNAKTIRDIVIALSDYISFFNYDIMERIVTKYAPSDEPLLKQYLTDFKAYCDRNVFEVPPTAFYHGDKVETESCFALKYSADHPVSLNQVKSIQIQIAAVLQIDACNLRLLLIEDGCVLLVFTISKELLPLSTKQEDSLNAMGLRRTSGIMKAVRYDLTVGENIIQV